MKYAEEKLQEIVDQCEENGTMQDFQDWCHGTDFVKAFQDGHLKKGDPILMFLINGMQLFHNKLSDCWMNIWIIFNLDPKTGHYKKVSVLFGGTIPGPNKPKNLESFLFPGLHHLFAIQNEGLHIWDVFIGTLYTSNLFLVVASADSPVMAYINGLVWDIRGGLIANSTVHSKATVKGLIITQSALNLVIMSPAHFPM